MKTIYYTKRNGTIVAIGKNRDFFLNSYIGEDLSIHDIGLPIKDIGIKHIPDDKSRNSIHGRAAIDVYSKTLKPCIFNEQDLDIKKIQEYAKAWSQLEVLTLYDDYISNIKAILSLQNKNFDFQWKDLTELNERPIVAKIRRSEEKDKSENPYVQDNYHQRYSNLGQDLINNGMYWAFVGSQYNDSSITVYEGAHRLYAMKKLAENNLWDNRKLLTLVIDNKITFPLSYLYPDKVLEKPISMIIPFHSRYPYGKTIDSPEVKFDLFHKNIKLIDEKRIEYYPQTYKEVIRGLMYIPVFLKFPMHRLQTEGLRIPTNFIINDEVEWNKWRKENGI